MSLWPLSNMEYKWPIWSKMSLPTQFNPYKKFVIFLRFQKIFFFIRIYCFKHFPLSQHKNVLNKISADTFPYTRPNSIISNRKYVLFVIIMRPSDEGQFHLGTKTISDGNGPSHKGCSNTKVKQVTNFRGTESSIYTCKSYSNITRGDFS